MSQPPLEPWAEAALTPLYLRTTSASTAPLLPLEWADTLRNLTLRQARSLTGKQIDTVTKAGLDGLLGSRWLMRETECEYSPPSRDWTGGVDYGQADGDHGKLDIAVLMVDDRPPLPYHLPGTAFASPSSWGTPRVALGGDYMPPHWGPMSTEQAEAMALETKPIAARAQATSPKDEPEDGEEEDEEAGMGGGDDESSASGGGGGASHRSSQVGPFQLALVMNHIFAQLHGYAFYLEAPCKQTTKGVDEELWIKSVSEHQRRTRRGAFSPKHRRYLKRVMVCHALSATHQLGPFPPRPAAWTKLAAIRYYARRHAYVLYLDSDAFVTQVWQPLEPLITLLRMRKGARLQKWLAVAGEYPPQKLRGDARAGLANSGVLLFAGQSTAGPGVMRLIEDWIWPFRGLPLATFTWPFEQNALSTVILPYYKDQVIRLTPGCPLNSPFGAYIRHYVGGTPDRSVYHPDHRPGWLLQALRCTAVLVAAAVETVHTSKHVATAGAGAPVAGAPSFDLLRASNYSKALVRPEGCAVNEPRLAMNVNGLCGAGRGAEPGVTRGVHPMGFKVLSRVGASWWRSCCAICVHHETCAAWMFYENWPANTINCMLLDGYNATYDAKPVRKEHMRHYLGRIPGRGQAVDAQTSRLPDQSTQHAFPADIAEMDVVVTFDVPPDAPRDP